MMGLEKTVFVNSEKIDTNESLKQAYMELGQAYYEGGFEDPLPQLLPLFDKITSGSDVSAVREHGKSR